MIVENKEMLHIHRNDLYSDIWKIGNEISVDDNYNSHLIDHIKLSSGVLNVSNNMIGLDNYLKNRKITDKIKDRLFSKVGVDNAKSNEETNSEDKNKNKGLVDGGVENTSFSLSEDSKGRKLNQNQKEYFKNSKVVDDNGNLKVLYNGSGNHTEYLPNDGDTINRQKEQAEKYWNPVFNDSEEKK